MKKLKILLSCFACRPHCGSEPGVGWNIAWHLAEHNEVWVLTSANNRPDIEAELIRNPLPRLYFVYHDLPAWARFWKWEGKGAIHLYYYLWQIMAIPIVRQLHCDIMFDLVQHVTYVKYWAPSALAFLKEVPFIWGPVGGGESAPLRLWASFGLRGILHEILRSLAQRLAELDPLVRCTAQQATLALASTAETASRLKRIGAREVKIFGQLGLPEEELTLLGTLPNPPQKPIVFLSIGHLIHWKGFHLGVMGFAQSGLSNAEYWVVGGGPERRRLESLAIGLDVAERVRFFGQLPRPEVLKLMGLCHVLIHPSLHDSGGLVCMEAMASGRPVICLDIGGPAVQVTDESGFKITARQQDQTVAELAQAMQRLEATPNLWQQMGNHARQRVQQNFCWRNRVMIMSKLYRVRKNSDENNEKTDDSEHDR